MILCFNPILPFLARLIVHGAFRDYDTIEELLGILPPEDEMLQLHWKDELLDTPFFKARSSRNSEERIETAGAFSKRQQAWGHRAGYPKPPTGHDFRAEGLYWIGTFLTIPLPFCLYLLMGPLIQISSILRRREWSMLVTRIQILSDATTCLPTAQMGKIPI